MRTRLVFAILLTMQSSVGCRSNRMNGWVGQHHDALVSAWGVPHGEAEMANGGVVFTYRYGFRCQRNFILGPDRIVTAVNWYGCEPGDPVFHPPGG